MKKAITATLLSFLQSANAVELPAIIIESSGIEDPFLEKSNTLTQEKIDISSPQKLQDLSSALSNTNISGIGNRMDNTVSIRGISNYVSYESSAAMYIDDIPVPFSYGFGMVDFQNVDSIDIFKGAQNTLFGKGSQSGLLHFHTYSPSDTFTIKGNLGYGSANTQSFYGFVSAPINTHLHSSFSFTKNSHEGFSYNTLTDNLIDKRSFESFSTKLLYAPMSHFSIGINYIKSRSDDGGSPFKVNTMSNPYSIDNEHYDDFSKMDQDLLSLTVKYTTSDSQFSSSTSLTKLSIIRDDYIDVSNGLLMSFDIDIRELSQEFKYTKNKQNSQYSVGAFYSDKLRFDYAENQHLNAFGIDSLNTIQNPDKNMALYSSYRYFLNPFYSIEAGLRYQSTQRYFDRNMNLFLSPTSHAEASKTWAQFLPSLSFSYQPDETTTLYASYSKGYSPGGYNYRSSDALIPFAAEKTDTYEIGYKTKSHDWSLSGALFYNRISDHVINQFADDLVSTAVNVSKAYSYGCELEADYHQDNLFLYSSFGLTKTKIQKSDSSGSYNGKEFVDIPDITASAGIKYFFIPDIYLKSSLRYMGRRFYNVDNTSKNNGYSVVDAAVGYTQKKWQIELFSQNLFDKEYVDFMIYTPSNTYYHFGQPQVTGIRTSITF